MSGHKERRCHTPDEERDHFTPYYIGLGRKPRIGFIPYESSIICSESPRSDPIQMSHGPTGWSTRVRRTGKESHGETNLWRGGLLYTVSEAGYQTFTSPDRLSVRSATPLLSSPLHGANCGSYVGFGSIHVNRHRVEGQLLRSSSKSFS